MSVRTKIAAYFHYLTSSKEHGWYDLPALGLLNVLAWLYEKGVLHAYQAVADHPEKKTHLPAFVISLGNLTIGGTGKTPTACLLAQCLQKRGKRVALLNRGYRAQREKTGAVVSDGKKLLLTPREGGDEACLMARSLPGVPVLIGRNRGKSGKMAIERFHSEVLLLDDGFQHWQLARDLDIVLIDATNPFGNGHLLPRGILREPLRQLGRASLFLLTKTDQVARSKLDQVRQVLQHYNPRAPICESIHQVQACQTFSSWQALQEKLTAAERMPKGQKVLAFSALGNPASFEQTVIDAGYLLCGKKRYEDHHHYSAVDIRDLAAWADEEGLPLVTTEKDAVKLPAELIKEYHLPLYVLRITITITQGKEIIDRLWEELL